jgi:FSR family fosmidomycin resistance protein-like MFS transporter
LTSFSLLVTIATIRSWISAGLVAYIPFYYISYLKQDPMIAGNLLFAFLAAGTVGTLLGGLLADRLGHKKSCPIQPRHQLSAHHPVSRQLRILAFFWLTLAGLLLIFLSHLPRSKCETI